MQELQMLKLHELAPEMEPDWLWDGYIAAGQITVFTAVWKSGKTTLLSHLLAQRKDGGVLLGQKVDSGFNVIISEEAAPLWQERHARLGFDLNDCFLCRPFQHSPTMDDWKNLLTRVQSYCADMDSDLVIIDPVSQFLPAGCENNQSLVQEAMRMLRRLTNDGIAVVLAHHPRKATAKLGSTARGCGAFHSFVDIMMEMYPARSGQPADPRRRLLGFSRFDATPRSLLFERNADAAGYTLVDQTFDDDFLETWHALQAVLEMSPMPLSRVEILQLWPKNAGQPKLSTLWHWLDVSHDRGLVQRAGAGTRIDPYRYSLPFSDAKPRRKSNAKEEKPDALQSLQQMLGGERLNLAQ